jgi:hypothetical protein
MTPARWARASASQCAPAAAVTRPDDYAAVISHAASDAQRSSGHDESCCGADDTATMISRDGHVTTARSSSAFALRSCFLLLLLLLLPPSHDRRHSAALTADPLTPAQLPFTAAYRTAHTPSFCPFPALTSAPASTPASCTPCLPVSFACMHASIVSLAPPSSSLAADPLSGRLRPPTGASFSPPPSLPASFHLDTSALSMLLLALLAVVSRVLFYLCSSAHLDTSRTREYFKREHRRSRAALRASIPGFCGCLMLLQASLISSSSVQPPCRIAKIEPGRGPPSGGTPVTVIGSNFTGTLTHVSAHTFCKWGSGDLVKPSFVSTTRIICESPPSSSVNPEKVIMQVTNDGGYTFSTDVMVWFYEGVSVIHNGCSGVYL